MSSNEEIVSRWRNFGWEDQLSKVLGKEVRLVEDQIECLKNSREKTSIWKLVITDGTEFIPIVLKNFKPPLKKNHTVEISMYKKAKTVFHEFMPQMYGMKPTTNGGEVWLFTEYLEPLRGQIKLTPKHLDQIIPTVAKFHALTFEDRFFLHTEVFDTWLPHYDSKMMVSERTQHIEKTMEYLDKAMKDSRLRAMVEPRYKILQNILKKGPIFFPEIVKDGQCLIHGDLHIHNICCSKVSDDLDWSAKLIDWESAKYAPCWYDMVVLVELSIDFRKDWHKNAEEIRGHCVHLYSQEMQKHGITFKEDSLNLLKMTYLQRTLEKRLLNHLRRVLNGEKSALLDRYLEKTVLWGKELGLY